MGPHRYDVERMVSGRKEVCDFLIPKIDNQYVHACCNVLCLTVSEIYTNIREKDNSSLMN